VVAWSIQGVLVLRKVSLPGIRVKNFPRNIKLPCEARALKCRELTITSGRVAFALRTI
jgi:hypothetical protein